MRKRETQNPTVLHTTIEFHKFQVNERMFWPNLREGVFYTEQKQKHNKYLPLILSKLRYNQKSLHFLLMHYINF